MPVPPEPEAAAESDATLPEAERSRGRWLAWTSHPAGMTYRFVYTADLPTLALVSLGASETMVGLQRSFERIGQLLQLPTLRAVGWAPKRSILLAGQGFAVAAGLPLVGFAWLAGTGGAAVPIVLASLALTSVGLVIAQTVWFPLLRGYVEPDRTGSFFGILRTGWHVTLILYFLAAQRWLAHHPGAFGLLFGVATLCGLLRIALVARLPEAPGERGAPVKVREALSLLRSHRELRRYLLGMSGVGAAVRGALPFLIVWMRRQMGLSDADVLFTTVAHFAGGLASLYLWGRVVDRVGAGPVLRGTAAATAGLFVALLWIPETPAVLPMVAIFFLASVLGAGFGVADTHLLFSLTPRHAPTRHLVVADVTTSMAYGVAPFAGGLLLETALSAGVSPLTAYRGLFATAALLPLLALIPLRHFRVR